MVMVQIGGLRITPEVRFCLILSKLQLSSVDIQAAIEISKTRELNWDRVLSLSYAHQIYPTISYNLNRIDEIKKVVPRKIAISLQGMNVINKQRVLLLRGELESLMSLLRDNGISVTPLKGPLLGEYLFGAAEMRHSSDLDLLIPKQYWDMSLQLISSAGYRFVGFNGIHKRAYATLAIKDKLNFSYSLDLHWDLNIPVAGHASETIIKDIFDGFSDEELLVFLCIHSVKHRLLILKWLLDIAQLCVTRKVNYPKVLEISKRWLVTKYVKLGLGSSALLYSFEVPSYYNLNKWPKYIWNVPYITPKRFWWRPAIGKQFLAESIRSSLFIAVRRLFTAPPKEDSSIEHVQGLSKLQYPVLRVQRELARCLEGVQKYSGWE